MADTKKVTSYVCTVTEEQAEALRILLDARGWRFSEQPYARWKAVREKTNIVAYNSGKLTRKRSRSIRTAEWMRAAREIFSDRSALRESMRMARPGRSCARSAAAIRS